MANRIKKQAISMLESRGYTIEGEKDEWITAIKTNEDGSKETLIAGYVEGDGSIGVSAVRDIVKLMKKEKATKGVIIADVPFTSYAKKEAKKNKIAIFTADRLKISLLEHEYIPKHEIMSKDETEQVLNQYNITFDQLPKIRITDPVVELIGAKIGQVLKITRRSETAGKSLYYRLVTE